ncbi:methyl-accepting chemotaxis protein [Alicyclobacillus kakegawensis]|uniref:methyl-accepting chemotaxis protein n=1 Tax=Alicyclobacillus kakegawensis TaxID=392012 RepID=UPI000830799C|nr:methyl-accepting chemotaxis protein [Alicyclobacillus kakegawensis]
MEEHAKDKPLPQRFHRVRSEVTLYWLGASAGAIAADAIFFRIAYREHDNGLAWSVASVILLIVILALLIQWRFRALFRPIQALYDEMMYIRTGDFRARDLDAAGRTDLVQVVQALQEAKAGVRRILEQMQQAASDISDGIESLRESAHTTSQASEQNASAMTQVMTAVDEERALTNQTVSAMQETMQSVASIQALIAKTQDLSSAMMENAEQGKAQMSAATDQMKKMEQAVARVRQSTQALEQSAHQVTDIVQAMQSIAAQTHMLALNAAVEAARAGGEGKGFAVVAAEVRKLAEQSRRDADTVRQVVTDMVSHVQAAAASMEEAAGTVVHTSQAVRASENTFLGLAQDVLELQDGMRTIETAAQAIRSHTERVAEQMPVLQKAADVQSQSVAEVAAASEEQVAMMEEVASTVDEISRMAGQLRAAAGQFQW